MPTSVTGFDDVSLLPEITIADQNGTPHVFSYAGHHVVPTVVFDNSLFLQALQANGLWNQTSFRTNGLALVQFVDGQSAGTSQFLSLVGGATHTGGHTAYNTALSGIFIAFDTQYRHIGLNRFAGQIAACVVFDADGVLRG